MPKDDFEFGVGSSAFQQGSFGEFGESNWTLDARRGHVPQTTITESYWDTIIPDLDKMHRMGIKTYRISLERSFIETRLSVYDDYALNKYEALIDACHERSMNVMLTLHHFTHPDYAADGFYNEDNIAPFIKYCQYVFNRFSSKVTLWCTLNEPGVEAFSGHLLGQFPPHHHLQKEETVRVLRNLMQTHMDVYHTLKQLPNGDKASIGIVHNILRFKSLYGSYDCLSSIIANTATTYTDDLIMDFLHTGIFKHNNYPQFDFTDTRTRGDYFGLNFYANPTIGPNLTNGYGATCRADQKMGDMYLPIDPKGFADALDRAQKLGLPIYITETGIADQKDALRPQFLIDYLRVIVDALAAGNNIRGFIVWTFKDNYEWNEGNKKHFGLFDAHGTPRLSARLYERLIKTMQPIFADCTLDKAQKIAQLYGALNHAERYMLAQNRLDSIGNSQSSSEHTWLLGT